MKKGQREGTVGGNEAVERDRGQALLTIIKDLGDFIFRALGNH